jgi:hypothetical protein
MSDVFAEPLVRHLSGAFLVPARVGVIDLDRAPVGVLLLPARTGPTLGTKGSPRKVNGGGGEQLPVVGAAQNATGGAPV